MILYISNRSQYNIGANTHLAALEEIFGAGNVFRIDLRLAEKPCRKQNYIAFGKYKNISERVKRWVQGNTLYLSNYIIKQIIQVIKQHKIKLVFTEESFLGSLAKKIKKIFPDVTYVCFYHDIAADLYRQWSKKSNIVGKIENSIGIRQEKINVKYSDINLVFHQTDADKLYKYYGINPQGIIPLTTFVPTIVEKNKITAENGEKTILFVGSVYYPNIIGIEWFYKNVLPRLNSNFKLYIVGKIGGKIGDSFSDKRVDVVGPVDSVEQYYLDADIVIAPLFDGGGMKAKTMEAISYAKCIVGTTESLHGFWENLGEECGKTVFRSDKIDEWIDIINNLLSSKIYKYNESLNKVFLEKFSYDRLLSDFKELFSKINI